MLHTPQIPIFFFLERFGIIVVNSTATRSETTSVPEHRHRNPRSNSRRSELQLNMTNHLEYGRWVARRYAVPSLEDVGVAE